MASQAFLRGIRAHRQGEPYIPGEGYDWRRGWKHAEFSARPSLSPSPNPDRSLASSSRE